MNNQNSLASVLRAPPADAPGTGAVPMPRRRWLTRWLLPALVLIVVLVCLGYSARQSLLGHTEVDVVAVVPRPTASGGGGGSIVVQAAGWVEADPYYIGVSALAEGVIEKILVLDGQRVSAGQVVARLVDRDARLALARAAAEVESAKAELAAAKAALEAAQGDWDHPVQRTRAVEVSRAALAAAKAELERLPSQIEAVQAR
mgnify:CR=1 FL=1